ncbi:P-loop containing nucleoside triphosphate hydrolase protein [Pavlovales sp. CCMP2436]|nr:P-loop containing nucleoside triphosphate hydrolase protein [Pavlovales sp. CCMP2436]
MSALEKIKDIEAELGRTQKNKATMSHIMSLKAKLAKYKRDLLDLNASAAGGGGGDGFEVKKTGDARVGLVGFPSVGKSTLLMTMTDVYSEVASYEFTTLTCIPGVIKHRGAKIQMLDLPGIVEGAKDGRGRGRQVIATARTCTMLLIVLDAVKSMNHKPIIEKELEGFGIRLNQRPPGLTFRRKDKGGVTLSQTFKGELKYLDQQVCRVILSEYRIANADIGTHIIILLN